MRRGRKELAVRNHPEFKTEPSGVVYKAEDMKLHRLVALKQGEALQAAAAKAGID